GVVVSVGPPLATGVVDRRAAAYGLGSAGAVGGGGHGQGREQGHERRPSRRPADQGPHGLVFKVARSSRRVRAPVSRFEANGARSRAVPAPTTYSAWSGCTASQPMACRRASGSMLYASAPLRPKMALRIVRDFVGARLVGSATSPC